MSVLACVAKTVLPRAVLLSTALLAAFEAGADTADQPLAGLDRYIEQLRADWKNVGAAVAVVRGSEVIYARGFGVKELGKDARVDADTLFQVGSTTKAFTTAALGILADEGKLRWDDPVIDYLPRFQLQDPWLTRNLTIRDAVTHRSGITGVRYYLMGIMDSDQALGLLRYTTPEAAFRDSFNYSNLMFGVAGQVVAAGSGTTWNEFVRSRLFKPLKMTRSGTSPYEFWDAQYVAPTYTGSAPAGRVSFSDARDPNVAMPHIPDESGSIILLPWRSYDNAAGAGAIVSSAADMAQWLILHLNEGRFEGRQLLKQETIRELHTTQNLHGRKGFPFDTKTAMGWFAGEYRSQTYLQHSGGVIGFPAYVALLPELKTGVVVLANGGGFEDAFGFHRIIALSVFDRMLGGAPPREWRKEFLSRAQAAQREARRKDDELRRSRLANAPPSLPLERYAGAYEDLGKHSGRLTVRIDNGRLTLSFAGKGAFSGYLEHWHHDTFRLRSEVGLGTWFDGAGYGFATYAVDPAGKVTSMSVLGGTFQRLEESAATSVQ